MRTNWILDGLLAAVLILAALLAYRRDVLFTLLPWSLGRSKRGRSDVVFYERMLRLLEKRKIVKPAYVTPMEFLDFPTLREHPTFSDIESLTSVYYRVRFGGETLAVGEDARINDILRRLKRANGRRGNPGQLKADVKQ